MSNYYQENYLYCPRCKYEFSILNNAQKCKKCGFIQYHLPAVSVGVIIYRQNQVLLTQRAIEPKINYWDLPGGFINPNENIQQAAIREVKEELNIILDKLVFINSYSDHYGPLKEPTLIIVFKHEYKKNDKFKVQDDVGNYGWYDKTKLPKKIAFNYIKKAINNMYK